MQFNFWPLNKTLPIDALINRSLFGVKLCFCFLCSVRNSRQLEGEYCAGFFLVIFYIWTIQIYSYIEYILYLDNTQRYKVFYRVAALFL